MNEFALGLGLAALALVGPLSSASVAITFCNAPLKDRRAAEARTRLGAAGKNHSSELETKGIGRCGADDDTRVGEVLRPGHEDQRQSPTQSG